MAAPDEDTLVAWIGGRIVQHSRCLDRRPRPSAMPGYAARP